MRRLVSLIALAALALPAAAAPPNVLLLSVDTLRADRFGCYGYELDTSPHLDALAKESLLFENAVCETPLTAPSMISMLTSLFPRMTGTTRNGLRLPEDVPTVAEQFKAAGYSTFCVQSNWTLKSKLSGLQRGFDVYEDDFHKKRWGFIKPERDAEEVTRIALEQLEAQSQEKPFFGWIHYSDPHAPYKMRKQHNLWDKRPWRLPKRERVRLKYDSEVAYMDAHIGKVLAALPPNTAILFVADHGESLYEHNYLGHGRRIYQPGMHIPLFIHADGVPPQRSPAPVRGIDVGPTLLALAGLEPAEGMLGLNLLAAAPEADRVRVVETYGGAVPNLPGAEALMADAPPMRQGVLHEGWKLILGGDDPQLFHLPEDPGELDNEAVADPDRVAAMRRLIETWDTDVERAALGEEDLNRDDLEALKSLGYLGD